jgi:hypothetical protein
MGRGGYHGGSSLLSFSWFGWSSGGDGPTRPKKKGGKKQTQAQLSPEQRKLAADRKSERQVQHVERQAEEMRLAKVRRAEKAAAQRAKPSQPLAKSPPEPKRARAGHGDPAIIALKANKRMRGVQVFIKKASGRLRLRKQED